MTEPDPMRARAEALHLHGLLAHWPEVAAEAWVAPLIGWEEQERARRSLERRLGADRKSTRLNSSHRRLSRMPSSA